MIGTYWTELHRAPLRWWAPLLVAVDLAVLYGRGRWWIGVWPQASVAAQIPAFYFGPLFAALAAWSVSRTLRRGFEEQLASAARPRWQIEAAQFTGTITYGVAAYLAGIIAAALSSAPIAGPGFLWPSYLALGLAAVIGCAAIGHAVGRWTRSRYIAPPFCALACFVILGSLGSSLGLIVLTGPPNAEIARWPLATRLLLAAAVVFVALGVPRLISGDAARTSLRWRGSAAYLAAGAPALLAGAVVGYWTAGALQINRPAPSHYPCTKTTPSACVWADDQKYLPQLTDMMTRLHQLPPGLFTVPPHYYELGLRDARYQYVDFAISEGSLWDVATDIAIQVVSATFPDQCKGATTADNTKRFHAEYELGTWLESRVTGGPQPSSVHGGPPGVDIQAVGSLIHRPEADQVRWVKLRLATISDTPCA